MSLYFVPQRRKSAGLQDVGFWRRFWSRFEGPPRLDPGGAEARPPGAKTTEAGEDVTEQSSLRQTAVWACVVLRSNLIASLPLHLRNKDKTLATEHPLYERLHFSPNADLTAFEWLQTTVACEDLWGNAYSRIDRNDRGDRIVALTPLWSDRMAVRRNTRGALEYKYQRPNGDEQPLNESQVLHMRGFTLDGVLGLSPIQYFAETLGGQQAANRAAAREFRTGAKVGGFLKTPGNNVLEPEERKLVEDGLTKWSQPENQGKFFLLEAGVEAVPHMGGLRMNPADLQLLETRGFGIEEICRAYGIPPPLIGHTDKASSWASSLSALNQFLLQYTIGPKLRKMELRMAKQLLGPGEWKEVFPRFNFMGLLRGSFSEQMTSFGQGLDRGIYSPDDVRDFLDMPGLPDGQGQEYRVPMNTEPVGSGDNAATPAPPAPPAPPPPAPPPRGRRGPQR